MNKPIVPDFTSKDTVTDRIWWSMCDAHMAMPIPLKEFTVGDLLECKSGFVYDRRYGIFPAVPAHHAIIMSTILAWDYGEYRCINLEKHIELNRYCPTAADWASYYLEHYEGTCYISSLSTSLQLWDEAHLNDDEREVFWHFSYKFLS